MSDCNSCSSKDGCNKDKENCMIENNPLNNETINELRNVIDDYYSRRKKNEFKNNNSY